MIHAIHHVQISVEKGQESHARDFYCKVMGFEELVRPESLKNISGYWLQIGTQQVHIRGENSVERKRSSNHLAYQVSCLKTWREKLRAFGLELIDGIPVPGMERFEFRDPFGNRIEMLELCGC